MATRYTRELLAPIVLESQSYSEVMRRLGLPTTGGNFRQIQARIRQAQLDTSHFGSLTLRGQVHAVPRERLEDLAKQSFSVAAVLRQLSLPTEGRAYYEMIARLKELAIDTAHFRGAGWARGETSATHPSVARGRLRRALPDANVFIENAPLVNGPNLRRRLLAMGLVYTCSWCGIAEWRGQPLVLHIDHINGISNDNRLENLRFLCPNCHSQTDTYCNHRRPQAR